MKLMTITELRKSLGLSQVKFSHLIEVDQPTVSRWERNPESMLIRNVQKVCFSTGCCCMVLPGGQILFGFPQIFDKTSKEKQDICVKQEKLCQELKETNWTTLDTTSIGSQKLSASQTQPGNGER